MAEYIDGFVIPIQKRHVSTYRKMSLKAGKIWKEYGALDYRETVGDNLKTPFGISFSKLAKARRGETVIFSWIVYKSKAHRDRVNAKVMKDKRIEEMNNFPMPFDCRRMTWGGFSTIVKLQA